MSMECRISYTNSRPAPEGFVQGGVTTMITKHNSLIGGVVQMLGAMLFGSHREFNTKYEIRKVNK